MKNEEILRLGSHGKKETLAGWDAVFVFGQGRY